MISLKVNGSGQPPPDVRQVETELGLTASVSSSLCPDGIRAHRALRQAQSSSYGHNEQ